MFKIPFWKRICTNDYEGSGTTLGITANNCWTNKFKVMLTYKISAKCRKIKLTLPCPKKSLGLKK